MHAHNRFATCSSLERQVSCPAAPPEGAGNELETNLRACAGAIFEFGCSFYRDQNSSVHIIFIDKDSSVHIIIYMCFRDKFPNLTGVAVYHITEVPLACLDIRKDVYTTYSVHVMFYIETLFRI